MAWSPCGMFGRRAACKHADEHEPAVQTLTGLVGGWVGAIRGMSPERVEVGRSRSNGARPRTESKRAKWTHFQPTSDPVDPLLTPSHAGGSTASIRRVHQNTVLRCLRFRKALLPKEVHASVATLMTTTASCSR